MEYILFLVFSNFEQRDLGLSQPGNPRFGEAYCLHRTKLNSEDTGTTLPPETSVTVYQSTQSNVPEEPHRQYKIDNFREVFYGPYLWIRIFVPHENVYAACISCFKQRNFTLSPRCK